MNPDSDINPYESPTAEEEAADAAHAEYVADTRRLKAPPKSTLPERCFFCNEPAGESLDAANTIWFSWSGIVSVKVQAYFCSYHKDQMQRGKRFNVVIGYAYIIVLMLSSLARDWLPVVGPFLDKYFLIIYLPFVALPLVYQASRWIAGTPDPVTPKLEAANPRYVLIENAGKTFLDSLREEDGPFSAVKK